MPVLAGKQNVHHLEREDLAALSIEAAAMARLPLAGTHWTQAGSKLRRMRARKSPYLKAGDLISTACTAAYLLNVYQSNSTIWISS